MTSKSSSKATYDAASTQEGAKSNSPVQITRPPRTKSIPNRLHDGIDRSIPGVSDKIPEALTTIPKKKGVSFDQQIQTPPRKKRSAPETSKGKEKQAVNEPLRKKSKPARRKRATNSSFTESQAQSSSETPSPSHIQTEEGEHSVAANAIHDIYRNKDAPRGFTTNNTLLTGDLSARFRDTYQKKDFCSVVAVDLPQLQRECNINLSPWLAQYESFISIAAPYSTHLVRLVYFNMETANLLDADGELVEERIVTHARGVKFTLSASIINTILQIANPPPEVSTPMFHPSPMPTSTPSTEIFPTPSPVSSTAIVPYSPPPTPLLDLLQAPSPSLFEDAKGGEKDKEEEQ